MITSGVINTSLTGISISGDPNIHPFMGSTYKVNTKIPMTSNITLNSMINPNLSFQSHGTVSSTLYGMLEQDINRYIWRSIFDTIPREDLEQMLKEYESRYDTASNKFFELWQKGEFEDTRDTNQWASLVLQLA